MAAKFKFVPGLFLVLLFLSSITLEVYADYKLSVDGVKSHSAAQAEISAEEVSGPDKKILKIEAKGLVPEGVYTVWLINEKPKMSMSGAGQPPYAFIADAQGYGAYKAILDKNTLNQWQIIRVVLHKDGDAKNMNKDSMTSVFEVKIEDLLNAVVEEEVPEETSNNQ